MKDETIGDSGKPGFVRIQGRLILCLLVIQAVLLLLGGGILLIGDGLMFAVLPILAVVLRRRSARQLFERFSLRLLVSYTALVCFLIGGGIYILVRVGFPGQNFICMVMHR